MAESLKKTHRVTPNPKKLLKLLRRLYPDPKSELDFKNEYQLVVAVILSAQCTDKKVNEVTPTLFSTYPDFSALSKAKQSEVETIIRPINYYKTKARNLIGMAHTVVSSFAGKLPKDHDDLTSLPGIGRKTANVVLGELGAHPALPVDTHVNRLAHRLGLSKGRNVREVETDLCALFEPSDWRALHHSLILHGRRVCKAVNPRCSACVLAPHCPSRQ
jgi:endonuclease-3